MRSFDAVLRSTILRGTAVLAMAAGIQTVPAQSVQQPTQPTIPTRVPTLPGANPSNPNDEDPMARQMAEQQAIRRNNLRQKQIVDETAKLVQLAQQLKDEAAKGKAGSDSSFSKKAEEIERLARSVKEKMREGQ